LLQVQYGVVALIGVLRYTTIPLSFDLSTMCENEGMLAARMMEDKPCRIKE